MNEEFRSNNKRWNRKKKASEKLKEKKYFFFFIDFLFCVWGTRVKRNFSVSSFGSVRFGRNERIWARKHKMNAHTALFHMVRPTIYRVAAKWMINEVSARAYEARKKTYSRLVWVRVRVFLFVVSARSCVCACVAHDQVRWQRRRWRRLSTTETA